MSEAGKWSAEQIRAFLEGSEEHRFRGKQRAEVSGLLPDLLIEQTKSRARKSNDNGLVESKNGAVIRKHMGYGYIAAGHAEDIHAFYGIHFNPYLNFHRPRGQPERIVDQRGKEQFVYKRYATPWETLRAREQALPPGQSYFKPGVSIEGLERIAQTSRDTEAARCMQQAKRKLFLGFRQERKTTCGPAKTLEERRGNAGPWKTRKTKTRKTKTRFPSFPTARGNRSAIPAFPPRRPRDLYLQKNTPKRDSSIVPA